MVKIVSLGLIGILTLSACGSPAAAPAQAAAGGNQPAAQASANGQQAGNGSQQGPNGDGSQRRRGNGDAGGGQVGGQGGNRQNGGQRGPGGPGGGGFGGGTQVSGMVLKAGDGQIKLNDGTTFDLDANARIVRTDKKTAADLKPGQFIAITAKMQPDATLIASQIGIFSDAFRNPAPGQRPMPSGDTMTNASIEKVDGKNLQVSWNGGTATVVLGDNVQVVYREVVKLEDLQPGTKVTATLREGTAVNVTVE